MQKIDREIERCRLSDNEDDIHAKNAMHESQIAEANHRISNNLMILSSVVSSWEVALSHSEGEISSAKAASILREVRSRVETVAALHRFLSTQPMRDIVNFNEYLRALVDVLHSSVATTGKLHVRAPMTDECLVRAAQVLPLALIITEAVTNAIKYAHPTGLPCNIAISCSRNTDGWVSLEIADDGVGLPDGFDAAVDGGLGLRTIRRLAQQLGAELKLRSEPTGLSCIVRVPTDNSG